MITVENVHKTYGGRSKNAYEALRGINLVINDGESLAIVGKSGSGKSTLMHLLAGLDHPTKGQVIWNDQSLTDISEQRLAILRNANIGFVFQQFFLQPTMTVLENATLPLKIAGSTPSHRKRLGLEVLEAVGLKDKANHYATDLSGGERQRVAIARTLINNPLVIFADEPTGNLDTETGLQVIKLLFNLQRERNLSLVIVTHDMDLARRCHRIVRIQDGKVLA